MDSMIFKNEDAIQCMNCGEEQDYTAEDYVLFGVGRISETTEICWNCEKTFTAQRINEDVIKVTINW